MKTSPFIKLDRRIATGEHGGIVVRWQYGCLLVDAKAGRKQLPHGLIERLLAEAAQAGRKLSEREIRYRLQSAETYRTEAEVGSVAADFGSWRALCDAGFPPVESDGSDPEHLEAEGLAGAPDEWSDGEQLPLDIPGLKPTISIRGRKVELVRGEDGATVADVAAYVAMCTDMHENFGKTVAQLEQTLATMREGADGDDSANAVEAWEAATDDDEAAS